MSFLPGTPPGGVGVYARSQPVDWLAQWDFVVLSRARADTADKARALMERGVRVWLFSGPDAWRPENFPIEIGRMAAAVAQIGPHGVIADPENGWPEAQRGGDLARALGRSLAEQLAGMTRVGVTSYPLFPHREALAEGCDGKVFGSPQIYGKNAWARGGERALLGWVDEWKRLFGETKVVPSVSAWVSHERLDSPAGYREYLSQIPPSAGSIGWTTGTGPDWLIRAYRDFEPGGSSVGTMVMRAISLLTSPLAIGIGIAILAILVLGAFA